MNNLNMPTTRREKILSCLIEKQHQIKGQTDASKSETVAKVNKQTKMSKAKKKKNKNVEQNSPKAVNLNSEDEESQLMEIDLPMDLARSGSAKKKTKRSQGLDLQQNEVESYKTVSCKGARKKLKLSLNEALPQTTSINDEQQMLQMQVNADEGHIWSNRR